MNEAELARLQRRLERERLARKEAERRLEDKARELHFANRKLLVTLDNLEKTAEQHTHELRQALERAEAANRAKNAFLATVSHEIRPPLHGILGTAEVLLHTELGSEQQQHLTTLQNAAKSLLAIIDGALDFAKPKAGSPAPAQTTPEVKDAIRTKPTLNTNSLTILVVDDNPVNQQVAMLLLSVLGHKVSIANTGEDAVSAVASSQPFDLVLMDLHMPNMDGFAATRAIRSQAGQPGQVPIIALTADTVPGIEERCRQNGMNGFVIKPFTKEKIQQMLAALATTQ